MVKSRTLPGTLPRVEYCEGGSRNQCHIESGLTCDLLGNLRAAAMTDVVSTEVRSRMMSGIRGKNTRPELRLRRFLHKLGYRYRVHDRSLPGTPDIVMPRFRVVILVHGCFWHRHVSCKFATTPRTNAEFWQKKFASNVERDRLAVEQLMADRWKVIVIWECSLKDADAELNLQWLPRHITNGLPQYLEWPTKDRSIVEE